jgi:GTP-binding protein
MFFDAQRTIGRIDKQLTEYILENHKPAVFVFNKWDLLKENVSTEEFADYVAKMFPMLDYVPLAFTTAKDGKNVFRVLNLVQTLAKQARARVTTGELNRVLRAALDANPPSQKGKRLPKVYFASQVAVEPPTIVLFTNGPELFDDVYRRYLTKHFRDHLPFSEVAIKLDFRARQGKKGDKDPLDEPESEPEAVAAMKPKPVPAPKPRKPGRKKKGEKSELWDV